MNPERLKKAYLSAAIAATGIIFAIVLYTVLVEFLRGSGAHKPPLAPPAAYAAKYALYIAGLSALAALKLMSAKLGAKMPTPEDTLKALTTLAIVKAALCEVPAVAGLVLFLLAGFRADFYLLVVFSLALEIYHFPRLGQWEERIRGDFGQL